MNIKGIIFDLDGVLLDSMGIWDTVAERYLISEGIIPEEGTQDDVKALSILQAAEYFDSKYGIQKTTKEIIEEINDLMKDFYFNTIITKPGVIGFLEILKSYNIKMCIATATERFLVEAALKRNKMDQYFDKIFTCPEVKQGKDRPDIYLKALDFLGIPKGDTIIFEDALYAIKTAKSVDFKVAAIYEKTADLDQSEIKELADIYITSYEDVVKNFDKYNF